MEVFQTMIVSYIIGKKACKMQDARRKTQDIPYFVSHLTYIFFLAFCFLCLTYLYIGPAFAQKYDEEQDIIPLSEFQNSSNPDAKSYSDVAKAIYWEKMSQLTGKDDILAGYKEAVNYIDEAIQLDPRSSFLHTKLAETSIALKDYDTAKSEIDTAIELDPSNADAYYLSGYLKSTKEQDRLGALAEFKKATELDPDNYNAQRFLGILALDAENYKLAANAYSQLVRLRPYEPDFRYRLGIAYSESGEVDKAIEEFKTVIMLDENNLDARLNLANLYSHQSQNKEAIDECLFILKHVPNNYYADVIVLLAQLYYAEGDYDKTILMSESVLKGRGGSKKNIAGAYYTLGAAYKEKNEKNLANTNFQKSIDMYKSLLEESGKNIDLNYNIAIVYDAMENYDLAEKHLQRLIVLKPDEPDAYNYLGYILVEQNRDLDKATDLIEKAIAINPNDGTYRDSLGWAYFKLGKLDEAVTELERAVELIPDGSEIHEHLGEAYLEKGGEFTAKAIQEWEKAIELKPTNISLKQKLNNLQTRTNTKK